jgi:hypothetical protein
MISIPGPASKPIAIEQGAISVNAPHDMYGKVVPSEEQPAAHVSSPFETYPKANLVSDSGSLTQPSRPTSNEKRQQHQHDVETRLQHVDTSQPLSLNSPGSASSYSGTTQKKVSGYT